MHVISIESHLSDLVAINESTDPAVIESEKEVEDSCNQFEMGESKLESKLKCHKNVLVFPASFERTAGHARGKEKGS